MNNNNGHRCNCQHSKPSKTVQTDSDIFYDLPDELSDELHPKSSTSKRSSRTTTQNDCNRDHPNLSHEPNTHLIEAPAGPRQQPVGQQQTYHAKDKKKEEMTTNNDELDDKEQPDGSCLCLNLSQERFDSTGRSPTEAAGSSKVKLSFATHCAGLQGSYECLCKEEDEESCEKFECRRRNRKNQDYDCIRVHRSLLANCKNEIDGSVASTSRSVEQKSLAELCDQSYCGILMKSDRNSSLNNLYKNSRSVSEDAEERFETATSPRSSMDDSVVPLLKNIVNVLQTMRDGKYHLGPMASKNIEISLDDDLSTPRVPPPSSKYQKQALRTSCGSESCSLNFISKEDHLSILEPPERDLEDYEKPASPTSQRLIPVDMESLRNDEELVWEPDLKLEDDEFDTNVENVPQAQFLQFPETKVKIEVEEDSSEHVEKCEEVCSRTLSLKNSLHQTTQHQEIQVNEVSLQNLTSPSAQFLVLDDKIEEPSDEDRSSLEFETQDIGTDCPDFDNTNRTPQNQEMSQFLESLRFDLEAMQNVRQNGISSWQNLAKLPCPSTGGWQKPSKDLSFPATIEMVHELGANSLFVKWRVQNTGNIGGYEVFLDGHLTNRYFSSIHRAAVICNVNLHCPHRITLRAKPLLQSKVLATANSSSKCPSPPPPASTTNYNTHPEASCPQSDGSVWYPSVYHFEPNFSSSAHSNAVLY